MGVNKASPIRIRVSNELKRVTTVEKKSLRHGSLKVTQYAENNSSMSGCRRGDKLVDLLHEISNVGSSEGILVF